MSGNWIGSSYPRVGGNERVTGAQQYAADLRLDHVLQVKLVSLNCACARIKAVNVVQAMRIAGVRGIITAADLPDPMPRYGPARADRPILAVAETKFFGEPVAAIAAETEDAAEDAARLIGVDFEERPAVLTIDAALDPASPLVQDPSLRPGDPLAGTNTLQQWQFGWGNVDTAAADLVIENDYAFPMVTHFAIEPHAFLAAPDPNGVTIWSPTQHPYVLQRVVAKRLDGRSRRFASSRLIPGGGFGGKGWPKFEPLLAFMALRLGRPVRLVLTLEETFQAARRASARIHSRTGFSRDGRPRFSRHRREFHARRVRRHRRTRRQQGELRGLRSLPYTSRTRNGARALVAHDAEHGVPRFRNAASVVGRGISTQRGCADAGHRSRSRFAGAICPSEGETFIPHDTPADGDWAAALDMAAGAIAWDNPRPAESRPRDFASV